MGATAIGTGESLCESTSGGDVGSAKDAVGVVWAADIGELGVEWECSAFIEAAFVKLIRLEAVRTDPRRATLLLLGSVVESGWDIVEADDESTTIMSGAGATS
jgi:hypothetical protein